MKIGILGGGFDPLHLGHLWAAQQALEIAGLDNVWWVPYNKRNLDKIYDLRFTNYDKHIINYANNKQRLEMTGLAIRGHKNFKVLDTEIKRGGVSYTIDTIRELKKKYSQDEFFVIIGEDLVEELPKWKEHEYLKKMVNFCVVPRLEKKVSSGIIPEGIIPPRENLFLMSISSTAIRDCVKKGLPIRGMVGKGVENYIYKHGLYK